MPEEKIPGDNGLTFGQEEPEEAWRFTSPEERPTRKLYWWLSVAAVLIIGFVVYLNVYFTASDQLYKDYQWVSAGYALVPGSDSALAKGRHIAITRGCQDCHGLDFSGKLALDNWQGRIPAPNLTRGKGSAVLHYYDNDWVKAIKHGIGTNNKPLLIMPSGDYNNLSDDDLLSMIAYLEQLPPINHVLPAKKITPLTYIAVSLKKFPPIAANNIDHTASSVGEVKPDTTLAYGQYISSACMGCHGSNLRGATGPNLTNSGDLRKWTYDNFTNAIIHGRLPSGNELKPAMPWKTFASMNETELTALYKYLKSLQ